MLFAYFMLLLRSVTVTESESLNTTLQQKFGSRIPALSTVVVRLKQYGMVTVRHNGSTICTVAATENTTFGCSCFPFISSSYELLNNDVFVTNFSVGKPKLEILLPAKHRICNELVLRLLNLSCEQVDYSIRVQYRTTKALPQMENHFDDVLYVPVTSATIVISGNAFVLPGIYKFLLETNKKFLKESIFVKINNNAEYTLTIDHQQSIFPYCKRNLRISWTRAKCSTSTLNFRLRVFAVPDGSTVERSYYLEEIHLDFSEDSVLLPCSMFDIIYPHFCFELVSIQDKTMLFYSWDRKCLKTENLGHVDGIWGRWSNWSKCSASCGIGIRRRYRYCNQPSPKGSGIFCSENFVETENCSSTPCQDLKELRKLDDSLDKYCKCGCFLNQVKGTFFAQTCSAVNRWSLIANGQILILYLASVRTKDWFRVMVFEETKKVQIFFDSGNTTFVRTSFRINTAKTVIIEVIDITGKQKNTGVQISYEWLSEIPVYPKFTLPSLLNQNQKLLFEQKYILLAITLVSFCIVFFPPILFAVAVRRKFAEKAKKSHISLLDQSEINGEMFRSGNTESTVLTAEKVVTKRSIGIQLSTTSTPRIQRTRESSSRETSSMQQTPRLRHSSLSCFADHELEYDYYEPAIPGSFLTPVQDFHSEIDIDQIIGLSCLRDLDVPKTDANTQA